MHYIFIYDFSKWINIGALRVRIWWAERETIFALPDALAINCALSGNAKNIFIRIANIYINLLLIYWLDGPSQANNFYLGGCILLVTSELRNDG